MQPNMNSAVIFEYTGRGNEKRQTPTTFRIIGTADNYLVEVQVSPHRTVEVNVNAIKVAELKHRMGKPQS